MKLRIVKTILTNGYVKDVVYKRQFKFLGIWWTYKTTESIK